MVQAGYKTGGAELRGGWRNGLGWENSVRSFKAIIVGGGDMRESDKIHGF